MSDFEQLQAQDAVYALAGSSNSYFVGRASGLYRSEDGGETWRNAYGKLEVELPLATTALAVQGRDLFAGVMGGVLRSSDGGQTWFVAAMMDPPPLVVALLLSPNFEEDGILLAGTAEDGVYSSSDRGGHWTPWNFGLIDLNIYSMAISPDFANDQMVFVGTETGIFRSKNGGRAWRALPFPLDAAPVLSLGISPNFATDNCLFAGTESSGLFVSSDRGQTWQVRYELENSEAVNAMVVSKNAIWLVLDDRVIESQNRGYSWKTVITFPEGTGTSLFVDKTTLLVGVAEGDVLVADILKQEA